MKHKSKNGIIMKSNIKILAACSFMMASMASCDLTGINDNPDKPTDDVNYNMSEPRLEIGRASCRERVSSPV